MIEDALINYGVLGLWTAALLVEKYKFQKELKKIIETNTRMLILVQKKL